MTYCLAIKLEEGLVFCSDSRTNAGTDQVSTYSKMHRFGVEGRTRVVLLSAGNLGTTQAVTNQIARDVEDAAEENINVFTHLADVAEYVGRLSVEQQKKHGTPSGPSGFSPDASFLVGGQIGAEAPGVFLVYPQGNYITTSDATMYLQIGESKYGKPILDRILQTSMPLDDAAKCALVSMDSTMQSNVTVGPPVELLACPNGILAPCRYLKLEADSAELLAIRNNWGERISQAFATLPGVVWGIAPAHV